jgi:hypothetical protein
MRHRRGNSLLETAMFVPVLILLLVGMVELARITYTYYTLHKTLYTLARYLGTRQGANLCDDGDAEVASAKEYALTGATDGTAAPFLSGLTSDMIRIRVERSSADSAELGECECSVTGCDAGVGGRAPDFIVVSLPDGYPVRLTIPYLGSDPILLRPSVRLPFGGT